MTVPKNLRAADQAAFNFKNRKDFTIRRHGLSTHLIYKLFLLSIIICLATAYLVYNEMVMGAEITTLLGLVLYVFAKQIEAHKKTLASTEFLNALLSSALGQDHKFCMIVKQDDNQIVYLNRDFQAIFPEMSKLDKRTLDILLHHYDVGTATRKTILQTVKKAASKTVATKFNGGEYNKPQQVSFMIEPIPRPAGFSIIRGK